MKLQLIGAKGKRGKFMHVSIFRYVHGACRVPLTYPKDSRSTRKRTRNEMDKKVVSSMGVPSTGF